MLKIKKNPIEEHDKWIDRETLISRLLSAIVNKETRMVYRSSQIIDSMPQTRFGLSLGGIDLAISTNSISGNGKDYFRAIVRLAKEVNRINK